MVVPLDPRHVRLSAHAVRRCEEMRIPIPDVVTLLSEPDVIRPAGGAVMALADRFPFAAVYVDNEGMYTVITIVWRSVEPYERQGHTFRTRPTGPAPATQRRQSRRAR